MLHKLVIILLFASITFAKSFYTVQLESVKKHSSISKKLLKNLKKSNIPYEIVKKDSTYKLMSGKFITRGKATFALRELINIENDAFITKHNFENKDSEDDLTETKTIQIMAAQNRESITNSAIRIIQKSGYSHRIINKNSNYYLLVGEFKSKNKLSNALSKLKKEFGENIFARNIIENRSNDISNNEEPKVTRKEYQEFLKRKNLYAGVVLAGMNVRSKNNLKLNNSLGAGFQLGVKLPYNLMVQSQYLFYPQVKEVRNNNDLTSSHANRTYHQFNLSLKREFKLSPELSFYPKAGLSVSRYDIDDTDSNYLRFESLYDTNEESDVLFNPHIGIGFNYKLNNNFNFDIEYLRTFELDLNQVLVNLNYEY